MDLISIADLPHFDDCCPDWRTLGFPENFTDLFAATRSPLLRYRTSDVLIFRNSDILAMAANPTAGNTPHDVALKQAAHETAGGQHDAVQRMLRSLVFTSNPPMHTPKRRVFMQALSPKSVAAMTTVADESANTLFGGMADGGTVDFMSDFCLPFTTRFWGAFLGLTEADIGSLLKLLPAISPLLYFSRTTDETDIGDGALGQYLERVCAAIDVALAHGRHPLIAALHEEFPAVAAIDPELDRFGVFCAANLFDGFHTVSIAIANTVYQLARHPFEQRRIHQDPALIPAAVTEALRLSNPLIISERHALADFEFRDVAIPRGTAIAMLWAAGNQDPEVHHTPSQYNLHRASRKEVTFGGGIHICPGRYVVRMLSNAVLTALVKRGISVQFAGDPPRWIAQSTVRELVHLPVTLSSI